MSSDQCTSELYIKWLRTLANDTVANNVDGKALGRIADHIESLEEIALKMFDAIASLEPEALGIVPEAHDCPAYPIRDELLHKCAPPIRHLLKENTDE